MGQKIPAMPSPSYSSAGHELRVGLIINVKVHSNPDSGRGRSMNLGNENLPIGSACN